MRYIFNAITTRRSVSGRCPACGRRVTRSRTFKQTVNPFNRNASGEPKTREEVWQDVNEEADAWEPDFRHQADKCAKDAS